MVVYKCGQDKIYNLYYQVKYKGCVQLDEDLREVFMGNSSFLNKNEKQANYFVSKTMRITLLFLIFVYVLNLVGVFEVHNSVITIATIIGTIFLLIPTLLVNILHLTQSYIKYVNVFCSIIFVTVLIVTLNYHVVVMFIYPIAIASIYFSKQLNMFAISCSLILFSLGQVIAYYINGTTDYNVDNITEFIVFLILPRALELLAISIIFSILTSRTSKMLNSLMNAEQQEKILNNLKNISAKSLSVSNDLFESMQTLSDSTSQTTEKSKDIVALAESVTNGSTEALAQLEEASESMENITSVLSQLAESNADVVTLSSQVDQLTSNNSETMKTAMKSMQDISNSNDVCIDLMNQLSEKSKNIMKVNEVITSIAGQTNLLALNASIESARAGEQGRGFGVVAQQIGKLAQQSKEAVADIDVIIRDVISNTESAMASMQDNAKLTTIGLDLLTNANQSTVEVTEATHKINTKITDVNRLTQEVADSSSVINEIVATITEISSNNVGDMKQVAAASEETFTAMQNLDAMVSTLEELATDLNEVVSSSQV